MNERNAIGRRLASLITRRDRWQCRLIDNSFDRSPTDGKAGQRPRRRRFQIAANNSRDRHRDWHRSNGSLGVWPRTANCVHVHRALANEITREYVSDASRMAQTRNYAYSGVSRKLGHEPMYISLFRGLFLAQD